MRNVAAFSGIDGSSSGRGQVSVLGGRGGADLCAAGMRCAFSGAIFPAVSATGGSDGSASPMSAPRRSACGARVRDRAGAGDDMIVVVHVEGVCHVGQRSQSATLRPGEGTLVSAEQNYFFEFPDRFRQLVLKVPRALLQGRLMRGGGLRLAGGPAICCAIWRSLRSTSRMNLPIGEENGIERAHRRIAAFGGDRAGERTGGRTARNRRATIWRRLHPAQSRRGRAQSRSGRGSARPVAAHAWRGFRAPRRDHRAVDLVATACRGESTISRTCGLCERSITDIAFAWGFNDAAHFSRELFECFRHDTDAVSRDRLSSQAIGSGYA